MLRSSFFPDRVEEVLTKNKLSNAEFIACIWVQNIDISVIYVSNGSEDYYIPFLSPPSYYQGYESGTVYRGEEILNLLEPAPLQEGEPTIGSVMQTGGSDNFLQRDSLPLSTSDPDATLVFIISAAVGAALFVGLLIYRKRGTKENHL